MRTRVKICGITRVDDAMAVIASGADAIGLVFYRDSPRYVTLEQARQITDAVSPFVTVVGLFVDALPDVIRRVTDAVPLGLLQFHGSESNDQCNLFGLPFIKSIAVQESMDVLSYMQAYPDAAGFLLDAWQPELHGGSGKTFDWKLIPEQIRVPVILAGGLTPGNVVQAIQLVRPYAVDVSSGVESAKGIKSADKITAFLKGVENSGTGG